jgi:hypothetical protein
VRCRQLADSLQSFRQELAQHVHFGRKAPVRQIRHINLLAGERVIEAVVGQNHFEHAAHQ